MIANFFSKTKPIHAVLISVIFLVFYMMAILVVEQPEFSFFLLLSKLTLLIGFLVLFFMIRFINRKNHLSGQDSFVLLILALLFAMFPRTMIVDDIAVAHFLLLFSFRRVYSIRSYKNVKQKVFDSAFWIGIATLIYSWSFLFILLVFGAIIVYKKQEIRNSLIAIVGLITPLFLSFTYYFVTDSTQLFYERLIFEYSFSLSNYSFLQYIIPVVFLVVFVLISLVFVRVKINALTNDIKPSIELLLIHLILATSILLVTPDKIGSEFVFAFFPICIFVADALQLLSNKIIKEVVVYSFCLVALSVYFLQ